MARRAGLWSAPAGAHNREVPPERPASVDRPASVAGRRSDGSIRAAIDLGTNSFHLVIARVADDGTIDVVARDKEVVRLGSGKGELRTITPEAIERGLAALDRFRLVAESYGASVDAIGTSALREAANRDDFVGRARDEVGIEVDVVSGVEEARLIHLGVLQALPLFDERIVVVDIGGGSTELVVGQGIDALLTRSLKLGAIRLTDRFFPEGRVRSRTIEECRTYVRAFLAPALADVTSHAPFTAVGSSGTILNLARIVAAAQGRDPETVMSGDSFSAAGLADAVEAVLSRKTAAERADVEGLDERRRDIIPAGAILLQEIVGGLGIREMVVSEGALREGILVDRVAGRGRNATSERLADIRRRSASRMAATFHDDLTHIEHATRLALQLFDELADVHHFDPADRELLEAAGLLHNVGLFISHAAHHRHSYYVIRNTDQLVGFTDREVELIAQVARYHRKSAPKPSHAEFEALSADDRRRVSLMAGMLRLAIALDRTRRSVVRSVRVRPALRDGRLVTLVIDVVHERGADVSLEGYTAEERLGLLAGAIDAPVELRFVAEPASRSRRG
jgi:exopolyphosphatase/guanosine-5'-triphosphate,3'-diphosphate pyrophosphatase